MSRTTWALSWNWLWALQKLAIFCLSWIATFVFCLFILADWDWIWASVGIDIGDCAIDAAAIAGLYSLGHDVNIISAMDWAVIRRSPSRSFGLSLCSSYSSFLRTECGEEFVDKDGTGIKFVMPKLTSSHRVIASRIWSFSASNRSRCSFRSWRIDLNDCRSKGRGACWCIVARV